MGIESLSIFRDINLPNARLVLGFSGWMDGGDTSTGTIEYLVEKTAAEPFAQIAPGEFYIYNFPGSMEMSALFRPSILIEDGRVRSLEDPSNTFFVSPDKNLVLFQGKEPNMHWKEFADCILAVAERCRVSNIVFIGSVASLVPHTRETRFLASISHERMRPMLDQHNIAPSNYAGPGSFISFILHRLRDAPIDMASVVAEVPMYYQGKNIKCIHAAVRKLMALLDLDLDLEDLDVTSKEFERQLSKTLEKRTELKEQIRRLEEEFDSESNPTDNDDLRDWFERQGFKFN